MVKLYGQEQASLTFQCKYFIEFTQNGIKIVSESWLSMKIVVQVAGQRKEGRRCYGLRMTHIWSN